MWRSREEKGFLSKRRRRQGSTLAAGVERRDFVLLVGEMGLRERRRHSSSAPLLPAWHSSLSGAVGVGSAVAAKGSAPRKATHKTRHRTAPTQHSRHRHTAHPSRIALLSSNPCPLTSVADATPFSSTSNHISHADGSAGTGDRARPLCGGGACAPPLARGRSPPDNACYPRISTIHQRTELRGGCGAGLEGADGGRRGRGEKPACPRQAGCPRSRTCGLSGGGARTR